MSGTPTCRRCNRIATHGAYCQQHATNNERREGSTKRGYNYRWQQARNVYISNHPLCVLCEENGIVRAATEIDHIRKHNNNPRLFWDESNWQSLCRTCHQSKTARGQ